MTLDSIYRQVNSKLEQTIPAGEPMPYHNDTVKAINDAIRHLRIQYIQGGQGHEFLESETIDTFALSTNYPYFYEADLAKTLLRTLPISQTVGQSLVWISDNELTDTAQTYSAGDFAVKDGVLYKAVDDIDNTNTYDLTFDVVGVRNFYPNNGITYAVGDIVRDMTTQDFYRATSAYTNTETDEIADTGSFEKLYWRKVGDGYTQARFVPFTRLHETRIQFHDHYPFSILEDKIYSPVNNKFTLSYIPEWTQVTDLTTELSIPDTMLPDIQTFVVTSIMGTKGE